MIRYRLIDMLIALDAMYVLSGVNVFPVLVMIQFCGDTNIPSLGPFQFHLHPFFMHLEFPQPAIRLEKTVLTRML